MRISPRCRDMGLNSFRMSIEWARVQPGTVLGSVEGLAAGGGGAAVR